MRKNQKNYFNFNRVHLTKRVVCRKLDQIWKKRGCAEITGHSFWVGGASLRCTVGVPTDEICKLGRWISDCYKLYLREYSKADLATTLKLLFELEASWQRT
ncbi:hypothetical protein PTTG_10781 [Puccinia triticina 1-1 BBBD Race 1]|uniref:Uncharacterized protein n=1 Tax=Puccinia triticina (isolate 1-1 / race 1 (BBBD)) TaxID=630390 RepID=A0A180FX94_PUCT1|nr:hypothetical protein PTTG_10781 [Puccinia triticina 1-1 BBBD Race 1]